MKTCIATIAGLALFCWCTKVEAVEIKGTVRSATADAATIVIEGESAPNVGGPVEIYFKLPGADAEISVGSGKVTAVHPDSVEVKANNVRAFLNGALGASFQFNSLPSEGGIGPWISGRTQEPVVVYFDNLWV